MIQDSKFLLSQAIKFHSKGNIKEALKYYESFISKGYKNSIVYTNYGAILKDLGKLNEAKLSFLKAIELNPKNANTYYNLGTILIDLNKLKEAETTTRKAIELNPKLAIAHYNLATILLELGKIKEVERSLIKSIEIDPDFVKAYYVISSLKKYYKDCKWISYLFSEKIIENKSLIELVDIYFARSNICHIEGDFSESSRYLKLANNIKLKLRPSKVDFYINRSIKLYKTPNKLIEKKIGSTFHNQHIFVVGMPRSGSTLLENILSMNNKVFDLGEINILEETFIEQNHKKNKLDFDALYTNKCKIPNKQFTITTNKWLFNYQLIGIIINNIRNYKIIHCHRNPLDNILSMHRAHFAKGNEFASSIIDSTRVYIDHEKIISKYNKLINKEIYKLNYDLLVNNPEEEIKLLISWLGWKWNDNYLSPHLNSRIVSTASSLKVRFPIDNKSVGSWRDYKDLLKPAIEILEKNQTRA